MQSRRRRTYWMTILATILLATAGGCTEWLAAPFAGTFAAGYWLGHLNATGAARQTSTCYRNGEPIDCSAILPELQSP